MQTYLRFKKHCIIFIAMSFFCFSIEAFSQTTDVKVETKQIDAQKALVIKTTVPSSEVGKSMGDLFGKLYGYIGANSIQPSGPPFAVYYEYDPKGNTVYEVCIPVASETKGNTDVTYKEFPAMKVLSTLYIGPYEKVGPTYEYLMKYIKDKGLQISGASWEVYLNNPSQETDPNKLQTVIYFPIK